MKFNTHVQKNQGHLRAEIPLLAKLRLPEDWGANCPFPGCRKRLSTRFGLRSTWMAKHFQEKHAGEALEMHAAREEADHLNRLCGVGRLRGGNPSQASSASPLSQGLSQTPSSAAPMPVLALNALLNPLTPPALSQLSQAAVADPGLQVPSQDLSSQATTAMGTQPSQASSQATTAMGTQPSQAPSTPPSQISQSPPPPPSPGAGAGGGTPPPGQGGPSQSPPHRGAPSPGDPLPSPFAHFRDHDWEGVCNWKGLALRTIP